MSGPCSPASQPRPQRWQPVKADTVYINMGRYGDAIASIPLCYHYWKKTGKKCALMVAKEFSSFFDGVSYIIPEIWTGDFKDVPEAIAHCNRRGYQNIHVAQVYGRGITPGRTTSSFILESWSQVGMLDQFDRIPMVFDRRNGTREAKLTEMFVWDKPVILVAADGHSAPVPFRDELFSLLRNHVGERALVVDMADIKVDYLHDFLGLFDKAACLVTGDTAFGQLACASKIPVCALIAYLPTTWHSSPQREQHNSYIRYNEWAERKAELLDAVDSCLTPRSILDLSDRPMITHVWTGNSSNPDTLRRINTAKQTWNREAGSYQNWREIRFTDDLHTRSALDLGEKVALPYIHDMMDYAAKDGKDEDIVVITNADICMSPGLSHDIAFMCGLYGSTYSRRWDFPRIVTHVTRPEVKMGKFYVGCDMFACTVKWWRDHKHMLPPFLIGRECWDWGWRVLVEDTGGIEINCGIYHEKHDSPWERNRDLAGNIWNRSYMRAFLEQRHLPYKEIGSSTFTPVVWP